MTEIKYPILAYAPGNYYNKCSTCGEKFTGDKLARQCEPCAINTLTKYIEKLRDSLRLIVALCPQENVDLILKVSKQALK